MRKPLVLLAALALGIASEAFAAQVALAEVAQLSARGSHACVVTTAGGVKCWGSNSHGQLGGGPTGGSRDAASDVVGLSGGSGVVGVAASTFAHTCAILTGGAVKCWGANSAGQLGDGTAIDRPEPVDVQGLPWPAVALTGGNAHTCALSAAGAVACWGRNSLGQLGDGTTTASLVPVPVAGLSGAATAISAGHDHTCAIVAGGGVQCWGAVYADPSNPGSATPRAVPTDVPGLASGATWIDTHGINGGTFDPARGGGCAVASGIAQCWSLHTSSTGPAAISGIAPGALAVSTALWSQPVPINRLNFHGHGCALSGGGGVKCWGTNRCGILGDGTAPVCSGLSYPVATATDVVGLSSGVTSIAVAPFFACALLADRSVKCWGGGYGSIPVAAVEGTSAQSIFLHPDQTPQGLAVGGTAPLLVSSSGGSGNPVVFSSLTPDVCSVSGSTVTGVGGGTCTVAANQAGSPYYDPAPQVTLSFPVDPRLFQQIAFTPPATLAVDAIAMLTATSSSGRPVNVSARERTCSISAHFLRGIAVGTCTLVASHPGDSVFAPAKSVTSFMQVVAATGTRGLAAYVTGGGEGTVTSAPAGIDCGPACAGNFAAGSTVTLVASASPGSTFKGWSGACSGTGPCAVTMDAVKAVTARFGSDTPRLANLSTRGAILAGDDALIGGFIIGGTANKTVVVRALGPSLAAFGVTDPLADPTLRLVRSADQVLIAYNESMSLDTLLPHDGNITVRNGEAIRNLGFGVSDAREAAILVTLAPGAYTAIVTPAAFDSTPGVGLFEVFEVDAAGQPLINVSTRGVVGSGHDVLIAGFIIQGSEPQTVVVRGRGPSLAAFGVPNALGNPVLQLVRSSDQAILATNDNWQAAPNAAAISASGFAPSSSPESAILATLQPGAYTAILSGFGGAAGTAIVEVFRSGP